MANQFLSLSLFLMLLAFFIVLNSNSVDEEQRERKVLDSIALSFSNNKTEIEKAAPEAEENPLASISRGDTLTDIEGLFNANVEGFEVTKNLLGTVMHVRLPVAKFENALQFEEEQGIDIQQIKQGEKGSFIKTLVSLLRAEERGVPFRMDMILNTENTPAKSNAKNTDDFKASMKRIGGIITTLENAGVPTRMMSAGLVQGNQAVLDIYIHKHKPFKFPKEPNYGEEKKK